MNRINADEVARDIVEKWNKEFRLPADELMDSFLQSAISSTITRYAEALNEAMQSLSSYNFHGTIERIDSILSRSDIPEMEEVETSAFRCPSCMRLHETDKNDCACGNYCSQFVKLTGTIQRPKAKPVVKSVSTEAYINTFGEVIYTGKNTLSDICPECSTKTGTITFTWPEPAK